jgi:hypothetical protein
MPTLIPYMYGHAPKGNSLENSEILCFLLEMLVERYVSRSSQLVHCWDY